jgi:hypothetical protein
LTCRHGDARTRHAAANQPYPINNPVGLAEALWDKSSALHVCQGTPRCCGTHGKLQGLLLLLMPPPLLLLLLLVVAFILPPLPMLLNPAHRLMLG